MRNVPTETSSMTIRVSAVVLRDASGAVLTVRKRGTRRFMLPGGKPEPGESPRQTAVRECAEEVGVDLDAGALRDLGVHRAAAANEDGFEVEGAVFERPGVVPTEGIAPAAEIEELRWLDPAAHPLPEDLAPLLRDAVLPLLDAAQRS
jgi:8-oxo-dGTP pyrophosphatase MutT (NUDIX family)